MDVIPLSVDRIPGLKGLLVMGEPYIRLRGSSDYWLYSQLFSSTCPLAVVGDQVIGAVLAFRGQDNPGEVYIQDVMTDPARRRNGVTRILLDFVERQATAWGCGRLFLTSEPDNQAAHEAWLALGFRNVPGDRIEHGVSVVSDYKGPGKHRAVYERLLLE
ncbi:GNAT family N-acetyltransferase [Plantactinospora sp. S1510]|uniref:GNAT family N-acetyltransferase n=1 Tax=Plantactinospora alkalitolerans TaxID=2789879 RepID=A0ABS0H9E3_9ACTN|nr:GNAT family N-acetyltransferase [Plantactinospora alkalitolerans]MBF9134769.1 GNAT family N-acetyltransferase [Plantactinospora alkalitolerans]